MNYYDPATGVEGELLQYIRHNEFIIINLCLVFLIKPYYFKLIKLIKWVITNNIKKN